MLFRKLRQFGKFLLKLLILLWPNFLLEIWIKKVAQKTWRFKLDLNRHICYTLNLCKNWNFKPSSTIICASKILETRNWFYVTTIGRGGLSVRIGELNWLNCFGRAQLQLPRLKKTCGSHFSLLYGRVTQGQKWGLKKGKTQLLQWLQ